MADIMSLTMDELKGAVAEAGEKAFRADQIFGWIHKKGAMSFEEMPNVPKKLKESLSLKYSFSKPEIAKRQISKDGTEKYLLQFEDGSMVETVLMKYKYGYSQCISSQVGCRMGCSFCASGLNGLKRNLTAGEMLSEIYTIEACSGIKVSNVVIMGTGEPLDNFDNLVRFLTLVSDSSGRGIGGRQITVSTCGLVPAIYELAKLRFTCTLALSLHAADQEKREKMMPVAKAYRIEETIKAMRYYANTTGRRVTFEYALIKNVNDSDTDAKNLASLIRGIPSLVNLIPVNPVVETGFLEPDAEGLYAFQKKLEKNHINVTIRRRMGRDIDGACGQLREKYMS
ncbi:MAG: 23S rRNA (adenine(2503)-C(2))-methyltransferase RlmN [Lachnospiraceae bacterium]|jgi:23S rRNA (adenine2503-C2)-methyltransferase